MKTIVILMGMLLSGNLAMAETSVYQWTDESGTVHYTSLPPPPGTTAEVKSLQPIPSVGTVAPQSRNKASQADPELTPAQQAQRDREELARRRIEASSYEEALTVECDQAESVLGKLLPVTNIQITDAEGNVRVMDEKEWQERIRLAREFIRDNC